MGNQALQADVEGRTTISGSVERVSDAAPDIDRDASANFSAAKVVAIFTVVAGHWFAGTILWIPVTFGLFVFAFSSAYFTSRIYGTSVDRKRFWHKKLERLGLRFWVILAFLSILLTFEGRSVLHWHTLVHFFGLSGVLNWLSIPNRSPLGAGLWFFTLLLIFYLAYPGLARLNASRSRAAGVALTATVAAVFLEMKIKVGHELWLTSLGFVWGVAYGLHRFRVSAATVFVLAGASCAALLGINLFSSDRQFNTGLIAATGIFVSLWLASAPSPPSRLLRALARFDKYLLEIFVIHTYLFVHPSGRRGLDFVISGLLVLLVAMALNRVVELVSFIVPWRRGAGRSTAGTRRKA